MLKSTKINSAEGTIIGAGVKLTGSLKDEGPITINGQAQGEIDSDDCIYIGENAHVRGPISARSIIVAGIVEGEIKAGESLEITPTGKVSGKIDTKILIIKPGALFVGQCQMSEQHSQGRDKHAEQIIFEPEEEEKVK